MTAMVSRVLWSWRLVLAAIVALTLVAIPAQSAYAERITVAGTVYSKNESKETIVLITDAFGVKNQPITIDLSDMSKLFVAVGVGQSLSLVIEPREDDSYLAYSFVSEGSYVIGNDLGAREEFAVRDSSIKAHVGNMPEDDESLAQQHRNSNLQRDEDDD
jgi:hypothetical protein